MRMTNVPAGQLSKITAYYKFIKKSYSEKMKGSCWLRYVYAFMIWTKL